MISSVQGLAPAIVDTQIGLLAEVKDAAACKSSRTAGVRDYGRTRLDDWRHDLWSYDGLIYHLIYSKCVGLNLKLLSICQGLLLENCILGIELIDLQL
jgi:hypothetical protein